LSAYLPGFVMFRVLATWDFSGSIMTIRPDHSLLSSVDPSLGHAFSVVRVLHFLHASSFIVLLLRSFFYLPSFCRLVYFVVYPF